MSIQKGRRSVKRDIEAIPNFGHVGPSSVRETLGVGIGLETRKIGFHMLVDSASAAGLAGSNWRFTYGACFRAVVARE